ncbi:MAG: hypothetical protein IKR68_07440 [Lachnospiraceae bacterium]|nr:hypothetical protein [Lachnospiraceae bacterium]
MKEFVIILAALIIAFMIKSAIDEKNRKKQLAEYFRSSFGAYEKNKCADAEKRNMSHYHRSVNAEAAVDEATASDLGLDELFDRINVCRSFYGEEALYDMLRTPVFDMGVLKKRNGLIELFAADPDTRVRLQCALDMIGRDDTMPPVDCIHGLKALAREHNLTRLAILDRLCLVAGIAACVLIFVKPMAGFFVFFAVLFINLLVYFGRKKLIDPQIKCLGAILRLISAVDVLTQGKTFEGLEDIMEEIKAETDVIRPMRRLSFLLTTGRQAMGNLWDVLLDYFRMFLHLDILRFYSMQNMAVENGDRIVKLSHMVGELDACIAVSSYRASLQNVCTPELDGESLCCKGLCHPLIENCVPNDIDTKKSVLLTGSNASGKSTFLRSVALAAHMAQTIYTVCAASYSYRPVRVASSMAVSDSVTAGDSYYVAEIKSLKRIMDLSKSGPLLCVVDEVLRGTNTAERIAASAEILEDLSKRCLCFAATHDLELAELLKERYENYHFTEDVDTVNGGITFGYKLLPGKAMSRNAIKLLVLMGYDDEITDRAIDRCVRFLDTGNWT